MKTPFDTLEEAQAWIESVEKFGEKYDLRRMENACEMLGHPQRSVPTIHIAGTNGKGSTLQYLNRILMASGKTTGTFTSPYIVRFNERITINDQEISDDDLLHYINVIYDLQKKYLGMHNDQITFFELVTLISFLYFKDKQPDVVIYETGLGGTLDATNVIEPILAIITSIGFDHMGVLGNTLESIASNKLGIVKKGVPLVSGITQPALFEQFRTHTEKSGSDLLFTAHEDVVAIEYGMPTTFTLEGESYTINMIGRHQVNNALVALRACDVLNAKHDYGIDVEHKKDGLRKARMPGRFETIDGIILDGAHNINGLEASLETLETYFPERKKTVVFTVMADKDYDAMLTLLNTHADEVIFTEIPFARSEKAAILHDKSDHPSKRMFTDFKAALDYARRSDTGVTLVTGSLYFISMMRKHLLDT